MRKILRFVGFAVLGVAILLSLGAAVVYFRGIPSYTPQRITLNIQYTPEKVELGAKIAAMQCAVCHRNPSTGTLAGSYRQDIPPMFGKIHSANITQDKQHGIGQWTDGDIAYFLRTGVRPNGKFAPHYMPKYPIMAHEDVEAIIAYLRSDRPELKATPVPSVPCEPSFMSKLLCWFAFVPEQYPTQTITKPSPNDMVAYGRYLVTAQLDCYACHSADFTTNNALNPEQSKGFLGGGNMLLDLKGNPVYSANITMDKETGIGTWTEEQFTTTLLSGKLPNGKQMRYPMLPYVHLTQGEAKAIFAYLKTVPTIAKQVQR